MAIIPWRPFSELDRLMEDESWLMSSMLFNEPAMDIYETDKDVVAKINLPGVDPDKVNVSVKDQILRISGSSEEKSEEKKKGYWRKEIKRGSFERAVRLPALVKDDVAEATYDKGVLEIVIPKIANAKATENKIKIKVK